MSVCHVCGSEEFKVDYVDEVFLIDGSYTVVEYVPAHVCLRCGERIYSRQTTEAVRQLIHSGVPTRKMQVDVFELDTVEG
ncbi:YgiT-type zinc finger protein [bacterium]|nr:YgiT-type zinc finger protein [bacterium]